MKEASIRDLVAWGCTLILAWALLYQGLKKIIPGPAEVYQSKFVQWGYDPGMAVPIAIVEIVAALLVLFPRTATIGAFAASVVMIGAAYTNWHSGIGSPVFAIVILVMGISLIFLRWPDSLIRRLFKS